MVRVVRLFGLLAVLLATVCEAAITTRSGTQVAPPSAVSAAGPPGKGGEEVGGRGSPADPLATPRGRGRPARGAASAPSASTASPAAASTPAAPASAGPSFPPPVEPFTGLPDKTPVGSSKKRSMLDIVSEGIQHHVSPPKDSPQKRRSSRSSAAPTPAKATVTTRTRTPTAATPTSTSTSTSTAAGAGAGAGAANGDGGNSDKVKSTIVDAGISLAAEEVGTGGGGDDDDDDDDDGAVGSRRASSGTPATPSQRGGKASGAGGGAGSPLEASRAAESDVPWWRKSQPPATPKTPAAAAAASVDATAAADADAPADAAQTGAGADDGDVCPPATPKTPQTVQRHDAKGKRQQQQQQQQKRLLRSSSQGAVDEEEEEEGEEEDDITQAKTPSTPMSAARGRRGRPPSVSKMPSYVVVEPVDVQGKGEEGVANRRVTRSSSRGASPARVVDEGKSPGGSRSRSFGSPATTAAAAAHGAPSPVSGSTSRDRKQVIASAGGRVDEPSTPTGKKVLSPVTPTSKKVSSPVTPTGKRAVSPHAVMTTSAVRRVRFAEKIAVMEKEREPEEEEEEEEEESSMSTSSSEEQPSKLRRIAVSSRQSAAVKEGRRDGSAGMGARFMRVGRSRRRVEFKNGGWEVPAAFKGREGRGKHGLGGQGVGLLSRVLIGGPAVSGRDAGGGDGDDGAKQERGAGEGRTREGRKGGLFSESAGWGGGGGGGKKGGIAKREAGSSKDDEGDADVKKTVSKVGGGGGGGGDDRSGYRLFRFSSLRTDNSKGSRDKGSAGGGKAEAAGGGGAGEGVTSWWRGLVWRSGVTKKKTAAGGGQNAARKPSVPGAQNLKHPWPPGAQNRTQSLSGAHNLGKRVEFFGSFFRGIGKVRGTANKGKGAGGGRVWVKDRRSSTTTMVGVGSGEEQVKKTLAEMVRQLEGGGGGGMPPPSLSSPSEAHAVKDVAEGGGELGPGFEERVKSFRFRPMPSVGGGGLGSGRERARYGGNGHQRFEDKRNLLHAASISPREGRSSKAEKTMTEKARGSTESELHGLALKILDDVDGDDAEAVEMLRISAHAGYGPSCEALAMCYEKGRGVVEHQGKARQWKDKARQVNDRDQVPGASSPVVGRSPISPGGNASQNGDGKTPVGDGVVGGKAGFSPAKQVSLFGLGSNGKGGEKSGGGGGMERSASMSGGQLVVVGTGGESSKGGKGWWLRQITSWASEAFAGANAKGAAGGDFKPRSSTRLVEGGVRGAPEGAKILKIVRPAAEGAHKGKGKGLVGGWVQGIQKARWRGRRGGDAVGKPAAPPVAPRHATAGVTPRQAPAGILGGGLGGGGALGESARALQVRLDILGFGEPEARPTAPAIITADDAASKTTGSPLVVQHYSGGKSPRNDDAAGWGAPGGERGDDGEGEGDQHAREKLLGF